MKRRGWTRESLPPQELSDLVKELDHVFTSDRPRSHESARALAPHAELEADPLFAEAPLASPRIPVVENAGAEMGGGGAGAVACRAIIRRSRITAKPSIAPPRPPIS